MEHFQQQTSSQAVLLLLMILIMIHMLHADNEEDLPPLINKPSVVHFTAPNLRAIPTIKPIKDIPIILWWTNRLFLHNSVVELQCPRATCYSTKDRRYLSEPRTRGLIFYGTDIEPDDLPLPRSVNHEWALFHEESPMNNYMLCHNTMIQLFNHTATFRRESDFPLTSQHIMSLGYLINRKPVPIAEKNKLRRGGLAPVLYAQSHCPVASDRDRYVEELSKHIPIDSIGKCLNNKKLPSKLTNPVESMESDDFHEFISQYKFHLAFENALCKDYMTEKLFRSLHVGSVPVYRGSPLAREWMPNNPSVIMVDDFESPAALAKFLIHLDSDDAAYEEYLQYKTPGGVTNMVLREHLKSREWGVNEHGKMDMITGFECHVCEKLAERYSREKEHEREPETPLLPKRWADGSHLSCPQPYPSLGHLEDIPSDDSWIEDSWIDDYWSGLDQAVAVKRMLDDGETDSSLFEDYWEAEVRKHRLYS